MESVFAQASFQFCGHLDEYLIRHTRHLALYYTQTRFGSGGHLLRRYEDGELVEERHFASARSIPLYYWRMWWNWMRELWRFSRGRSAVTAIFEFPLLGVGLKTLRKVRGVFWQWDYFPGRSPTERMYNAVAGYCAARCEYHPLTQAIAKVMGHPEAEVMMLGTTVPKRFGDIASNRILLVGQLRGGQGIEDALDFVANHREYELTLLGAAANGFEIEIERRIAAADISSRVYFPNRFVTDAELREAAAGCFVALALYDTAPHNLTHFADPGKVKSSIEMGLPVVMTRISDIAAFVERFHAGEVIESPVELGAALLKIRRESERYFAGCRAFAEHFEVEKNYAVLDRDRGRA